MTELLRKLCACACVSGDETRVADRIKQEIQNYASEIRTDRLGNLLVFKEGVQRAKTRLMLCAHMDEVGLMVTYITDEGFLRFDTVGGVDPKVITGRRVRIGKDKIRGVVGIKPLHLQSREELGVAPDVDKLYIDIGASSRQDALGCVDYGDTAVFDSDFVEFGDGFLKARALDDRAGCALLIELIKSNLPYDCWFAFTTQEEVGTRGAKTAAFAIKPEAAIVLEATTAADIASTDDAKKVCFLGRGPVLSFMDRRTIYDRGLYALAMDTAARKGIRCQPKLAVAGGNDAGAVHLAGEGAKTLAVSLPCRYLHSQACVIKESDAEDALSLLQELIPAVAGGRDGP